MRNVHARGIFLRVAGVGLIATLLGCVLAFFLGREIVGRPISELVEKTRQVGSGDIPAQSELYPSDEIGLLAREVDRMIAEIALEKRLNEEHERERRKIEDQLRHADRLATIGQLAAGVAHEIGTPLQSITARADLLSTSSKDPESATEHGRAIKEQSERISVILKDLLSFARKRRPDRSPHDAADVVRRAESLVENVVARKDVNWVVEIEEEGALFADIDRDQLHQVVTNLIMNGVQAMPRGGTLRLGAAVERCERPDDPSGPRNEYVSVFVEDEGDGIPEEVADRIFDPFFTTKKDGEGTGLGLSIAYGIVQEHGGWIDVDSRLGEGTRFSIYLPKSAAPAPEAASGPLG